MTIPLFVTETDEELKDLKEAYAELLWEFNMKCKEAVRCANALEAVKTGECWCYPPNQPSRVGHDSACLQAQNALITEWDTV